MGPMELSHIPLLEFLDVLLDKRQLNLLDPIAYRINSPWGKIILVILSHSSQQLFGQPQLGHVAE